jgi:tRNA A-37 threonylcarbamoyl transferase component Bud32
VQLLASGRIADVWALDHDRVLRRNRNGRDCEREAAVMRHAREHGFPVPEVLGVEPGAMVLERLHGPTMLAAFAAGTLAPADGGEQLGRLLLRLRPIPPGPAGPSGTLLHLDLHPDNVVLTDAGPVVIDWANAAGGPSALDTAMSAMILGEVAVGDGAGLPDGQVAARAVLAAMLRVTGPVDPAQLDVAHAHRAGNMTLSPAEKALLPAAARLVLASGP